MASANPVLNGIHAHAEKMNTSMTKLERQHLFETETDVPDDTNSDCALDSDDEDFANFSGAGFASDEEKSAKRGLLSSKVVRRSLRDAQKLLEENQVDMEPPPVPMTKLREMTQQPGLLEKEIQQNPTMFYEIYSWTQRVISMVYEAMKSVMASAMCKMHDLAMAMIDSAADLRDLELFKSNLHGVMGKFLNMAHHMKSKLEQLKSDLLKMTKNTGIVELRKGRDAVVLQHRLHDMMETLKSVREDFLGSISAQWAALEDKQTDAIQKQREELEKVKQKQPSILDNFKKKGAIGSIVGGGGVLVTGALVVGLLAGLNAVAAPLLIGIAAGFAVAGTAAAGFGAIVGRNMESGEESLKDKVQDVSDATKDIGITIGVMKNSIEMVSDSLSTLADTFKHVAKQILEELKQFDSILDQLNAFSLNDWCDVSKVRSLKYALPTDDSMESLDGDEVKIDLNHILQAMDHSTRCIDSFIKDIDERMEKMKPAKC